MRIFGWDVSFTKAPVEPIKPPSGGWPNSWGWPTVREPFTGAWQRNMELRPENILTYFAVYSCVSLIAGDIGKLGLRLMETDTNDISRPTSSPSFSPVIKKPNHFQTRQKFIEQWVLSKLLHGAAYILKQRDARGVVVALYVLNPLRVKVKVAPDSLVFYELDTDNLAGINEPVSVPSSEMIHDVMVALYHPLCGVSPLLAAMIPVVQGLNIQTASTKFFQNGSRPGGILTAPQTIDQVTADRLKTEWDQNFAGDNSGKIAVLGDGLKYEAMAVPAEEAQLIEQLKWTAENVCSVFHVPAYMIGIAPPPSYNNVEALIQVYYGQALQTLIESIETLLDEGLALPGYYHTEFDLDDLLRMDTATLIKSTGDLVKAGIASPNEARAKFNLSPVPGGKYPYLQQQNYSLEALAKRDEREAQTPATTPALLPAPESGDEPPAEEDTDEPPPEQRLINVDHRRLLALSRSIA